MVNVPLAEKLILVFEYPSNSLYLAFNIILSELIIICLPSNELGASYAS